jgi:hypothetical protein
VALAEAGDRRVIGRLVRADHARRDVLKTAPLDPPRRPLPERVGVEQQRDHHRRIVRRPTMPIRAVGGIERSQIELADCVDHKPSEMVLRQPVAQARRQQQHLRTITSDEVLAHAQIVDPEPDATTLYATATSHSGSGDSSSEID